MAKRIASLTLVLMLGGSVLAGVPMHSGSSESGMMDCCRKALEQNNSPHVAAARLCCAMNCNEPGSTSGNTGQSFSQTGSEPSPIIVAALLPATSLSKQLRARYEHLSVSPRQPTYILNLALLI